MYLSQSFSENRSPSLVSYLLFPFPPTNSHARFSSPCYWNFQATGVTMALFLSSFSSYHLRIWFSFLLHSILVENYVSSTTLRLQINEFTIYSIRSRSSQGISNLFYESSSLCYVQIIIIFSLSLYSPLFLIYFF